MPVFNGARLRSYKMYQLITGSDMILRVEDGAYIPADPNNTDYQNYLDWVAQGNMPLPPDPVEPPLPPDPVETV